MPRIRSASHAGSWYDGNGETLSKAINQWLADAETPDAAPLRAIIGPHAGYRYCGHVMAYAYKAIEPSRVKRVFLLGPSHHMYTPDCLLSQTRAYQTPMGSIDIDKDVYAELQATGLFRTMSANADEAEHSLELHMPFVAHVFRSQPISLVPIMVGALTPEREAVYGRALSKYLEVPSNLFIISSDFCHWGDRFDFTFYDEHHGPIYKSIEWLDHAGMSIIESGDPDAFTSYLRQYGNTICGRHPIGVLLQALRHSPTRHSIKFTRYDQSSQCNTISDSSVSYAAAVVTA